MSNVIQIKRGSGKPENGILAPYELGYDVADSFLYIGDQFSNTIGLKVSYADKANLITDIYGSPYTAGSPSIPIFLDNGIIKPCSSEDISMGMTVEAAQRWSEPRIFSINLSANNTVLVDGSANVDLGTQGILPIEKGGTGAATAEDARINLGINLNNLGITASTSEINKLEGLTATTAELNKLNGLIATATELNYCKDLTNNIQTQLNTKATYEIKNLESDGSVTFTKLPDFVIVIIRHTTQKRTMTGIWTPSVSGFRNNFYALYSVESYGVTLTFEDDNSITISKASDVDANLQYTLIGVTI